MRFLFIVVVGVSVALAGSAAAQYNTNPAAMRTESSMRMDRFGQQMAEHALDAQTGQNSENQNPRRLRRAQRAAEMINNGDCAGARTLAVSDRDQRLVDRIDQICQASPESPAPSPAAAPR